MDHALAAIIAPTSQDALAANVRLHQIRQCAFSDVYATLRSSIKRLLVKHRYPPDKQPEAIKLVIEQMAAMAPRLVG